MLASAYRELIVLRHSQDFELRRNCRSHSLPLGNCQESLFRRGEAMRIDLLQRGINSLKMSDKLSFVSSSHAVD